MRDQEVWAQVDQLVERVLRDHLDEGEVVTRDALARAVALVADEVVSHFALTKRQPRT